MIGFNELGTKGRLGNQMFQYAALRGIAAKHGYDWCIPPSNFSHPYYEHQLFEIFTLNSLKYVGYVDDNFNLVVESGFYFDSDLFNLCPDNTNLGGFFQSEKYFKHIENEIKEDFTFNPNILDSCKKIINELGNCLSIHVRKTDYDLCDDFLGIDYYSKALKYFDNYDKIIVFSDDIEWCKEQKLFATDKFFISEYKNNATDLCLMTLCKWHIIANSSFSWWGAWLSNSRKIVAPKVWFGKEPSGRKNHTRDIIPEKWIKI